MFWVWCIVFFTDPPESSMDAFTNLGTDPRRANIIAFEIREKFANFFNGNMNLVVLLTSLLLRNSTTEIDVNFELENPVEMAVRKQWEQYKVDFGKEYSSPAEDLHRMEIFMENSKMIEEHNELFAKGHYTYELGHNQFSDITHEEYLEQYTTHRETENHRQNNQQYNAEPTVKFLYRGNPAERMLNYAPEPTVKYNQPTTVKYYMGKTVKFNDDPTVKYDDDEIDEDNREFVFMAPANVRLPFSVDWRAQGAVTPVKNEGHCGASWAFSATGSLEGQLFRRTRHLLSLSEQNLLDCTKKYGNHGCHSGSAANAYRYIMANGGIDMNTTYPWHGKQSWICHYKRFANNPTVHGITHIQSGNETNLAAAVATVGPIAVTVDARSNKFKFYKNGIFNEPSCSSYAINRELVVVGYGRSFWIVKNSWGPKWGARGYIYMTRSRSNQCGIATRAVFPIV